MGENGRIPRSHESESCSIVSNSLQPHGLYYSPWNSPGQNTGVGRHSLLQGIFPTQGSYPGLPHCRWILYQLSHKGSPRKLEWVVYPFSSGSSWPRNQTGSTALQMDSLPTEICGKPVVSNSVQPYELQPARLLCPWDYPGKDTGMGCHFLFHQNKWE